MKWKSWTLKLKNSITGQRSCQKLQKKSNKIKLRRLLGYVFLTSCVILHGTKSLLLLPGLSFFLSDDSLVTSYLQANFLGILVIRPADIETIRPHPYELHANSGPTHGFYSILSNPFFFAVHYKYKIQICIWVPKRRRRKRWWKIICMQSNSLYDNSRWMICITWLMDCVL